MNDMVFHLAATERMGQAIGVVEPFMDPWVSEMVALAFRCGEVTSRCPTWFAR